jgi:hypothetical protein
MKTLAEQAAQAHFYQSAQADLWDACFGSGYQPTELLEPVLRRVIDFTNSTLNAAGRHGNTSLFVRDPFADRLNLVCSTVRELNPGECPSEAHFACKSENYDSTSKICYIDLFDRLTPDGKNRHDPECCRKRGVTGWIALTGCPLRLLGITPQPLLNSICRGENASNHAFDEFGPPVTGGRISETAAKSAAAGETQYLGVPVISVTNRSIVTGVFRYCARLDSHLLTECDLEFLKHAAHIVSAVLRHFNSQKQLTRSIKFPAAVCRLKETANFHEFLDYAAESLSSNISSIYVGFRVGGKRILRILEARGISAPVRDLRGLLSDYSATQTGITWALFDGPSAEPSTHIVRDDSAWRGRNTRIFYEKVFGAKGITFKDDDDQSELRSLVRSYSIKLLGSKLRCMGRSNAVGVFKVEFPTCHDAEEFYSDGDKEFFRGCCDVLGEEVGSLAGFLEGDWFSARSPRPKNEFVRLLTTVVTCNLLKKEEKPEFWEKVAGFITEHRAVIGQFQDALCRIIEFEESPQAECVERLRKLANELPEPIAKSVRGLKCSMKGGRALEKNQVVNIQNFTGVLGNVNESALEAHSIGCIQGQLEKCNLPEPNRKEIEEILREIATAKVPEKPSLMEKGKAWVVRNEKLLGATASILRKALGVESDPPSPQHTSP